MPFTFKTNPRKIGDQDERTVTLKGQPILKEANLINGVIKPGHLVEFNGDGIRTQRLKGQDCRRAIAMEMDLLGKTINDSYEISATSNSLTENDGKNSHVRYGSFHAGQEVMIRFESDSGVGANTKVNVVVGSALMAKGNGSFTVFADMVDKGTHAIIAYSLATVSVTGPNKEIFLPVEIA